MNTVSLFCLCILCASQTDIASPAGPTPVPGHSLIVAITGKTLSAEQKALLAELQPGGVILLGGNMGTEEQTRELTFAIKQAVSGKAGPGELPLIHIDQEGGRVNRLKLENAPSAATLGARGDETRIRETGAFYAREAAARGIDVLLAPVLDLSSPGDGGVIGDRAFAKDPEHAWLLGSAFAEGVMEGGGLPVVKHFPGHGGAAEDSHKQLARLDLEGEALQANLTPFKLAVEARLPAIMVGHIACAALNPEYPDEPASMSHAMVTGLLRESWGYDGMVITDDLNMGAVAGDLEAAALKSIRAGCDAIIICDSNPELLRRIAKAIEEESEKDPLFQNMLMKSGQRLEDFRSRIVTNQPPRETARPEIKDEIVNQEKVILVTHTVRPGDTLSKLATIYGVTSEAIRNANNKTDDTIRVGDILKIPDQ